MSDPPITIEADGDGDVRITWQGPTGLEVAFVPNVAKRALYLWLAHELAASDERHDTEPAPPPPLDDDPP